MAYGEVYDIKWNNYSTINVGECYIGCMSVCHSSGVCQHMGVSHVVHGKLHQSRSKEIVNSRNLIVAHHASRKY